MEKLMKTAKTVDTILKIAYKILQVGGIILLVSCGILLVACFVDKVPTAEVTSVSVSDVELVFSEPQMVDTKVVVIEMLVAMVLAGIIIFITCYMIKVLRKVLEPMKTGQPFNGTVSGCLRYCRISYVNPFVLYV